MPSVETVSRFFNAFYVRVLLAHVPRVCGCVAALRRTATTILTRTGQSSLPSARTKRSPSRSSRPSWIAWSGGIACTTSRRCPLVGVTVVHLVVATPPPGRTTRCLPAMTAARCRPHTARRRTHRRRLAPLVARHLPIRHNRRRATTVAAVGQEGGGRRPRTPRAATAPAAAARRRRTTRLCRTPGRGPATTARTKCSPVKAAPPALCVPARGGSAVSCAHTHACSAVLCVIEVGTTGCWLLAAARMSSLLAW